MMLVKVFFLCLDTVDGQLLHACQEGNEGFIRIFFKDIKPYLKRNIGSVLYHCLLICIEQGRVNILRLFLENGTNPDGETVCITFTFTFNLNFFVGTKFTYSTMSGTREKTNGLCCLFDQF